MADDIWAELKTESVAAGAAERMRCISLVKAEIEAGRAAKIPETSATMRILLRLCGAMENGG